MLARSEWPADYEEMFWQSYPRRIAKKDALRALYRIRKANEVPFEILLSAVNTYARSVVGKDMKYVAHPASWLNAGRWDDDPNALLDTKVKASPPSMVDDMVLIRRDSPQATAWEKHRGRQIPWGREGVWMVASEWPPS